MHNPKSGEFHQCQAKRHSIFFYHNIKDNERNLYQGFLITENTDLKVHVLHYANGLLVRVRLSFQNLLQTRLTCRNNIVDDKCTDHDKTHINLLFTKMSTPKKMFFFFRARAEKVIPRHVDASRYGLYRQRPSNF